MGTLCVKALYSADYEDSFYKIWVEDLAKNKIVYQEDYGVSLRDESLTVDDLDDILDLLFLYLDNALEDDVLEKQFAGPKVSAFDRQKRTDGDSDDAE